MGKFIMVTLSDEKSVEKGRMALLLEAGNEYKARNLHFCYPKGRYYSLDIALV